MRSDNDLATIAIDEVMHDDSGMAKVITERALTCLCSNLSVLIGNRSRPFPMALEDETSGLVTKAGEGIEDLLFDHIYGVQSKLPKTYLVVHPQALFHADGVLMECSRSSR
jgi:hypothetical protein